MKSFEEEVNKAVQALKKGKVILYPTETIWGLGCDATNIRAVNKIYKIKQRSERKSLIILVDHIDRLKKYVKFVPPVAIDLMENAATPLSIIYPDARNLAKNVMAADGTACIRITKSDFCAALVQALQKPIVSTSANISGEPTALTFSRISETIKGSVDHIVGLGQNELQINRASSIIKIETDGTFLVIRP